MAEKSSADKLKEYYKTLLIQKGMTDLLGGAVGALQGDGGQPPMAPPFPVEAQPEQFISQDSGPAGAPWAPLPQSPNQPPAPGVTKDIPRAEGPGPGGIQRPEGIEVPDPQVQAPQNLGPMVPLRSTSTSQSTHGRPVDPKEQKALQGNVEEEKRLRKADADLQAQGYNEQSGAIEKGLSDADKLKAQADTKVAEWDKKRDVELERIESIRRAMDEEKMDPDRFFKTRSTGQQIMGGIAAALGGFMEGMSGGKIRNTFFDNLDKAIERDLVAQKENYNRKKDQLGQSMTMYGLYRQAGLDERQAEVAARRDIYDRLNLRIQQITAKSSSERAPIAADLFNAQLERQRLQHEEARKDKAYGTRSSSTTVVKAPLGALLGSGQPQKDDRKELPDKVKEKVWAAGNLNLKLNQYKQKLAEYSGWERVKNVTKLNGVGQELQSIGAEIQELLFKANNVGVQTDADAARQVQKYQGSAWVMDREAVRARIERLQRGLNSGVSQWRTLYPDTNFRWHPGMDPNDGKGPSSGGGYRPKSAQEK